jgi:hypothetical protein
MASDLYDENGYVPFAIVGMKWDVNVTEFSVKTALLVLGTAFIVSG